MIGLVGSQNGAYTHLSVPKSLQYLTTNLYTLVVVFIYFHRLVEEALHADFMVESGSKKKILKLEKLQEKALKVIENVNRNLTNVKELYTLYGVQPFSSSL